VKIVAADLAAAVVVASAAAAVAVVQAVAASVAAVVVQAAAASAAAVETVQAAAASAAVIAPVAAVEIVGSLTKLYLKFLKDPLSLRGFLLRLLFWLFFCDLATWCLGGSFCKRGVRIIVILNKVKNLF
jgi:hypothetical protein